MRRLEREFGKARPGFQGTPLNRAGDLCHRAGDRERALKYYGRAIDLFLDDGQREAARGVANKLIRIHPQAVRTLATLTWLDLAAHHEATAIGHVQAYVKAARKAGQEARAREEIFEMAAIAPYRGFLEAVAEGLDELGQATAGNKIRQWIAQHGHSPYALTDPDAFSERCLEIAAGANKK
ncbi:MAG: hypothetical protein OEZ65_12685 [Gemmatimonadota bacterium]|nr:hypothetical protein [Gemmatimonadota bacterium]